MADIIEDYLRELEAHLPVDAQRKRQIIDELRAHLHDKVQETQAAQPETTREEVARQVIGDFGNPHDLALQYGPEGAVLKHAATGEVVLRVGRAVGRGTKAFFKGAAIAAAILLVLATAVGAWAYHEFSPIVAANAPYPVIKLNEGCYRGPCTLAPVPTTFYVHPDAREVRLSLHVDGQDFERNGQESRRLNASELGAVFVVVRDPAGTILYNRTFDMPTSPDVSQNLAWAAVPGNWTTEVGFDGFRGSMWLEISAIGLPREAGLANLRDVI